MIYLWLGRRGKYTVLSPDNECTSHMLRTLLAPLLDDADKIIYHVILPRFDGLSEPICNLHDITIGNIELHGPRYRKFLGPKINVCSVVVIFGPNRILFRI